MGRNLEVPYYLPLNKIKKIAYNNLLSSLSLRLSSAEGQR